MRSSKGLRGGGGRSSEPATEPGALQGSELTGTGQSMGGQQRFGTAEQMQRRVLAGKARSVGKA